MDVPPTNDHITDLIIEIYRHDKHFSEIHPDNPEYQTHLKMMGRQAEYIINRRGFTMPPVSERSVPPVRPPLQVAQIYPVHPDEFTPAQSYCPDLYDEHKCPKRHMFLATPENNFVEGLTSFMRSRILRLFPGVTINNESDLTEFENTYTFFRAQSAPPDLEDTYGESYVNRTYVYILVKPGKPEEMIFFSSEELVSSFLTRQDFVNPKSCVNEVFTQLQIDRLETLLEKSERDRPLYETIVQIKLCRSQEMIRMTQLSKHPHFKDCLYRLLEIGMLMRGWSGEGPYPLQSMDTGKSVNEDKVIDRLTNLTKLLADSWKPLAQLRLLKYDNHEMRFVENYPTLEERIKVVLDNENGYACIRITSNVFTATPWYYLNHFFHIKPFELNQLSYIL